LGQTEVAIAAGEVSVIDNAAIPARDACVLGALLARWARERPQHNLFEFSDGSHWTFAETLERTRRAAAGLHRLGVRRGSNVLVWLPNLRESILAWFGANYLGAVYVPINTAYKGALLEHTIALSDAEVLVAHASLVPRLLGLNTARLRDMIVVDGERAAAQKCVITQVRQHAVAVLQPEDSIEPEQAVEPWDPNYIMFTSGTTGPSKAVVCTYLQSWSAGPMAMDYFGQDDRILAHLPLFHVSGTGAVIDRLTKGGTCILHDGFKTDAFWDTVRRFQVTGCCLVGAMTQFLLKQPPSERDHDHPLRAVITVPWNQDSLALANRYGIQMHTAFNMTETATPITSVANPPVLGTCGRARPGVEARVVDENDMERPCGEVGELILRTSRPWEITSGYFRDPAATARVWRNGWFHTGDAFRTDAQGYFYFVDRLKDAIRRRGENISSFEVESEATLHPAVREAAAIPVASEFGEDEVMLVVAAVAGANIDPLELLQFMEPRMAHFMLPRYIRIIDSLPKTPTNKIEKHRLRSEGVTVDTWDREAHAVSVRHGALRVGV
jgi:crotonobetaine/carnitine-CoA ligase